MPGEVGTPNESAEVSSHLYSLDLKVGTPRTYRERLGEGKRSQDAQRHQITTSASGTSRRSMSSAVGNEG